jgi:hypothetical protein
MEADAHCGPPVALRAAMPTLIRHQISVSFGHLEIACAEGIALTLNDAPELFPATATLCRSELDSVETAFEICDTLRDCELESSHEHLFLLLYFNWLTEKLKAGASLRDVFLPLPKTRFTVAGETESVTVDFAFWTGERFVAVFIHHNPFDPAVRAKIGLLKIWGFDVYAFVSDEFEVRGLMGSAGLKLLSTLGLRES